MITPGPTHLFLEVTPECNLRCGQCHMWHKREVGDTLTTDEKRQLVEDFAELQPGGVVILTGGEPIRKPREVLTLGELCRSLGLLCVVNTNGTYVDARLAAAIVNTGPQYTAVSIDSHVPSVHNALRGSPDAFSLAVRATQMLVQAKRESFQAGSSRIYVSAVLSDATIAECSDFVEFTRALGVDGVTFQMLEPTFCLENGRDGFFTTHWFHDADVAKAHLRELAGRYSGDPFLLLSEHELQWMAMYIDHPTDFPEAVCDSHWRNLMVDVSGESQLCAYMTRVTGGQTLGNVRERSLAELWDSPFAREARLAMDRCRNGCGVMNCHRRSVRRVEE